MMQTFASPATDHRGNARRRLTRTGRAGLVGQEVMHVYLVAISCDVICNSQSEPVQAESSLRSSLYFNREKNVNSRDSSSSSSFSSVSDPSFIARLLHHIETIVHDEDDDDDDEWEPSTSCWSSTVCHKIKTSRLMFRNTKQWKP